MNIMKMENDRKLFPTSLGLLLRQAPLMISLTAALGLPALCAQNANSPDPIAVAATSPANRPNLSPMQTLLEPVALYPDPLLALVLAASAQPGEIQAGASTSDSAVRALGHYPETLRLMASNHQWTERLGVAFSDQPARVMEDIQALRHRALAAGTLISNSHIDVLSDAGIVRIIPRQADAISIPQYSGASVYFRGGAPLRWSADLPAGHWLTFIPVWKRNMLYTADWYAFSRSHGGWQEQVKNAQPWQADSTAQIRSSKYHTPDNTVYGRPQAEATPGNDYGYLLPRMTTPSSETSSRSATFQGDQYHQ